MRADGPSCARVFAGASFVRARTARSALPPLSPRPANNYQCDPRRPSLGESNMQQFRNAELVIEWLHPRDQVERLDWKGRSAAKRPEEALNPFLATVLAKALESGGTVEMHFEQLDFFNSSTVAVLVQFLHKARAARVPLCFHYLPTVRWQKLSFEALRVFEQLDRMVQVIPLQTA